MHPIEDDHEFARYAGRRAGKSFGADALIERACEQALTDPRGVGVRVDRYPDHIEVSVSDAVPFGEVHDVRHY